MQMCRYQKKSFLGIKEEKERKKRNDSVKVRNVTGRRIEIKPKESKGN
jgi:hypothetical protein